MPTQHILLGSAAGGSGGQIDTSAAHFYDFSTSYNDQVGSLNFNTNTSQMALGSSGGTYGNPPGWNGGYGYFASASTGNSDFMHTTVLPDMSGDFCIDCCSYNPNATSGNNMIWSLGNSGNSQWVWYIYNAGGVCNADSANSAFNARLGEIAGGSNTNYVQNKWCVSRYRRSGNTAYMQWYEQNGGTWQTVGTQQSATYTGSGNADGAAGWWGLNGWVHSVSTYSQSNIAIAWLAYYTDGSKTDLPYIP